MVRSSAVPRIRFECSSRASGRCVSRLLFACSLLLAGVALAGEPTVVLISLDGTPHAAVDAELMPALAGLAQRGALAEGLTPAFPTNTFPNHVTLATGVAPERHGIVNNVFIDPKRGFFDHSGDPTWNQAEPLWSIAARHGVVSASFYWVGSEGPWRTGFGPRYWKAFDSGTGEREKVEQILAWLDLEDSRARPRLVTSWFHGGDAAGHRFGPGAPEWKKALRGQDDALEQLIGGLQARGAFAWTTLIVVSDHGMARVERSVDLRAALSRAGLRATVLGAGGFSTVTALGGAEELPRIVAVARQLGLEAYARAQAPPALRVANPRFGDVVVLAPEGTAIASSSSSPMRGGHGYHPRHASMAALFVAAGRSVAPGTRLAAIRSVDVAPTVLGLLGIPAPEPMEGRDLSAALSGAAGGSQGVGG